jgi:phosphoribosylglycinamide formyltransferase 1
MRDESTPGTEVAGSVEKRYDPLAVLISGRGSNLKALIDARLTTPISVVISNRADAAGLEHARAAGIETLVLSHRDHASRDAYDRVLVDALRARGVGLVCLAGFMRLLGPTFCDAFRMATVNIHPSLLPAFPGVDAQAQAVVHGVKVAGATVHFVTPDLDAGPIISQRAVAVEDDDTPETLAARILAVEHALYPDTVRRLLTESWTVHGRRVVFARPA